MNSSLRLFFALTALAAGICLTSPALLSLVWIGSALVHVVFARSGVRVPAAIWMSVSLALTLWILQLVNGASDVRLLLKAACLVVVVPLAFQSLPWVRLGWRAIMARRGLTAILFLIFTRHFALVLLDETRRAYTAQRMSTPRRFGPGAFRSLTWATARVFERAFVRAERFYAARLLDGFAE